MQKGANLVVAPSVYVLEVAWVGRAVGVEVDISALMLGPSGKVEEESSFVFYNNTADPSNVVRHIRDLSGEHPVDRIEIDLLRVNERTDQIVIVASTMGVQFGQIPGVSLTVTDEVSHSLLATFAIDGTTETAVLAGEFYRRNGDWKFRAVGQGYANGLEGVALDYGIEVEPAETGARQPSAAPLVVADGTPSSVSLPIPSARPTGCPLPALFPAWYRQMLSAHGRLDTPDDMMALIDRTAGMITVGAAQPYMEQLNRLDALAEFHRRFDGGGRDESRVLLVPDDMIDYLWQLGPEVHESLTTLVQEKLPSYLAMYLDQHIGERLPMLNEWDDDVSATGQDHPESTVSDAHADTGNAGEADRPWAYLESLSRMAPVNLDTARPDWPGVYDAVVDAGFTPEDAIAATWCSFGEINIEALVDASQLTLVFPTGIVSTLGKRRAFGRGPKYDVIPFSTCRGYSPDEYTDARGFGKFCIEFVGAGGILLGRLQWRWKGRRFRDSRQAIMAVAEERDRILNVVNQILG